MNSSSASFSFPTFSTKATKEVSIKNVQDLDELKKKDPFMYYSVPQIREAAVLFKKNDFSLRVDSKEMQEVKRQTRISFETRDLFLEDFLLQETKSLSLDESDASDGALPGDDFLSMCLLLWHKKVPASAKNDLTRPSSEYLSYMAAGS
ncbi:hypothetical protein ACHAXN_003540 [Cyclotella atomus]